MVLGHIGGYVGHPEARRSRCLLVKLEVWIEVVGRRLKGRDVGHRLVCLEVRKRCVWLEAGLTQGHIEHEGRLEAMLLMDAFEERHLEDSRKVGMGGPLVVLVVNGIEESPPSIASGVRG